MIWYPPGWNITSLLHKGTQRKPQAVENTKFIGRLVTGSFFAIFGLFCVPFIGAKSAHQEQDDADPNVGEDNAHPDLIGQGVQKRKNSGFRFLGLFDHNGYAQTHKRFREIDDFFSYQSDRQRCNSNFCFLYKKKTELKQMQIKNIGGGGCSREMAKQ